MNQTKIHRIGEVIAFDSNAEGNGLEDNEIEYISYDEEIDCRVSCRKIHKVSKGSKGNGIINLL